MSPAPFDPDAPPPRTFAWRTRTAFCDGDPLGMVHHSRFAALAESATFEFFRTMGIAPEFDPHKHPDLYHVVRRFETTFHAPLAPVAPLVVALRVVRLREAGITLAVAFYSADGSVLHAEGSRTLVRMSWNTGAPCGWTPAFRAAAAAWLPPT